jgi:hypothetical protein
MPRRLSSSPSTVSTGLLSRRDTLGLGFLLPLAALEIGVKRSRALLLLLPIVALPGIGVMLV